MKARLAVTSMLALALLAVATPAPAAQSWNDYTLTGLPATVVAPVDFTLRIDGPDPVCRVVFGDTERRAAPWTFTYDPWADNSDPLVDIYLCDGTNEWTYAEPLVPFTVDRTVLTASSGPTATLQVTNHTRLPATAVVTDTQGRPVASVPVTGTADVTLRTSAIKATTPLTLTMTSADGTTMATPLLVTKGWSVFDSYRGQPRGHYAPCATIPWAYEPAGQPATAGGMPKDIAATFQLLTQVTGLTFVRADHVTKPGIAFRWEDMSDTDFAGYASEDRSVTIDSAGPWAQDSHTGFARARDGMPGRNWLLVHEIMHVLGYDHVTDKDSVMGSGFQLGPGDLEGLHTLYPKANCH